MGWRTEWNQDRRFALRVDRFCKELPSGSRLIFLNLMDNELFSAHMAQGTFSTSGDGWEKHGVHILHESADATDLAVVERVFGRIQFESAIVMGTTATKLSSEARDTRVLQIMLLLRQTHNRLYPNTKLHIVGENNLDSTTLLALASSDMKRRPDFVNTQAIYARVMVQALAYP